jgi:hypothetical protein
MNQFYTRKSFTFRVQNEFIYAAGCMADAPMSHTQRMTQIFEELRNNIIPVPTTTSRKELQIFYAIREKQTKNKIKGIANASPRSEVLTNQDRKELRRFRTTIRYRVKVYIYRTRPS